MGEGPLTTVKRNAKVTGESLLQGLLPSVRILIFKLFTKKGSEIYRYFFLMQFLKGKEKRIADYHWRN